MKLMKWSLAILASVLLAACGGGGGGGGGGDGTPKSCQDAFSLEAAQLGDDCTPQADTICPVGSNQVLNSTPVPCDGVTASTHEVAVGNTTMTYLAIRPSSGGTDTTVLALHYLGANTGRFSNVVRLSELAKARNVLVIAPQAVGPLQRWPSNPSLGTDVDTTVNLLKAVLADAKSRFGASGDPVYVSGLSNGAVMGYLFACRATDQVKALLAVSGELGTQALASCQPSRPLGTVIVHGTSDLLTPYNGIGGLYAAIPVIHAFFKQRNGCAAGDDASVSLTPTIDSQIVTVSGTDSCSDGRRDFLVTINGGGHNWPGGSANDSSLSTIGLLGIHTRNFDATLQGFDLLRAAAGDD